MKDDFLQLTQDILAFVKESTFAQKTIVVSSEVVDFFKLESPKAPTTKPIANPYIQKPKPPVSKSTPLQKNEPELLSPPGLMPATLEPISQSPFTDFSDIHAFFQSKFPQIKISQVDEAAQVILIANPKSAKEHQFVKNVALGIECVFGLKSIIQENSEQTSSQLKIFIIDSPLEQYITTSEKKKELWQKICHNLME